MTELKNRCVVTGLGMISAIGSDVETCFNNAINSITGIKETKSVDTVDCYAKLAAEVMEESINEIEGTNDLDRSAKLCIKATMEAISDSNLEVSDDNKIACIIGSCVGGVVSIEQYYKSDRDKKYVDRMPISAIASNVSKYFNLQGVVTNIANACAAGTISISYACDLIRAGKADVVIAGGADAFASVPYSGFLALHALDPNSCSPFNRCEGITLGEGAGIVVVESLEHAKKRNAKMYCEVLGSGVSSDAHHITAPRPDGEGQMNAINKAIKESGIDKSEIGYINAHGTGTAKNDNAEFLSLRTIFNEENNLSVSSTKAMVGHCLGAAGAIEAVFSIKALQTNIMPATLGYKEEDFDKLKENAGNIDFLANNSKKKDLTTVMSNSFAFGGNNASIVFSKNEGNLNVSQSDELICITGLGLVTPLGNGKENYINNLGNKLNGSNKSNVDVEDYNNVNLKMAFYRKLDYFSKIQAVSGMLALKDANITITDELAKKVGIVVGTSEGALGTGCLFEDNINQLGNAKGSAFNFPNTVYNAAGGYLSICSGIKGYNVTITNGASSGLSSISYAYNILKTKEEEIVLATGVDENIEIIDELYHKLDLVSDEFVEPFSNNSKFALSDGASSIVLERASTKNEKYAYVLGYGMATKPVKFGHIKGSDEALDKAILEAIEHANIKPSQIDTVFGFANGIKSVDDIEINSLNRIFKDVNIVEVKKYVGEGRAFSANLSVAHASLMLHNDIKEVSGYNLNLEKINIKSEDMNYCLVISYSSGGTYSAVVLKRV